MTASVKRNLLQRIPDVSLWKFCAVVAAAYTVLFTTLEFVGVPVSDLYSLAATGVQWCVVALFTVALLMLLCSGKWLFALTFPLLLTVTSVLYYLHFTLGTRITATSIDIALCNNATMWWSVISPGLIAVFVISLAVGILTAVYRFTKVRQSWRQSAAFAAVGVIGAFCPVLFIHRLAGPVGGRLPYSLYFAPKEYLANRRSVSEVRDTYASVPASASRPSPDVIVVLGESLRADHLPFNGYPRNTMPRLSRDTALISFPSVYTPYTYTDISLPRILTRADSLREDAAFEDQSFVSLFKKAGYRTAWIANQDLTRSYTYFAHECDTLLYSFDDGSLYSYKPWLDEDILPVFDSLTASLPARQPRLAIIHTIGSHWWYPSHYRRNQAVFKPEIKHKDVGGLSAGALINSYDNTIIATDEFLSKLFLRLRSRNAVVIFISDHGEGLGEGGVWLHGSEAAPQHEPACLVWYSEAYARQFPEKVRALRENRLVPRDISAIFHTTLDLGGISTPAFDPRSSLTAPAHETHSLD